MMTQTKTKLAQATPPSHETQIDLTTSADRVIVADQLKIEHIHALNDRSVLAVRIKKFFPANLCERFTEMLLSDHPAVNGYAVAPDILRSGLSLYDTVGDAELREEYFSQWKTLMSEERRLLGYLLSPINKLRLELGELTSHGFRLETLDGRLLGMGSSRIFRDGAGAEPHIDCKALDVPDCSEAKTIECQIAGNCYTQLADAGGELEILDLEPTAAELADLATDTYALNRIKLPDPALVLSPELGELILFRSTNIHAVRPSIGVRVAQSCFLAYRSNSPITGWS